MAQCGLASPHPTARRRPAALPMGKKATRMGQASIWCGHCGAFRPARADGVFVCCDSCGKVLLDQESLPDFPPRVSRKRSRSEEGACNEPLETNQRLQRTAAHAQPTTFCAMQFSPANQACAVLPPEELLNEGNLDKDDHHEEEDEDRVHNDRHQEDHGHLHQREGDDHDDLDHDHSDDDHRQHDHDHGHDDDDHGDHDHEPRMNRDCCRWIREVDKTCVCEALLHLPLFLCKTHREYTISVGRSCKLNYKCAGI